jgi:suppressor of ftsI
MPRAADTLPLARERCGSELYYFAQITTAAVLESPPTEEWLNLGAVNKIQMQKLRRVLLLSVVVICTYGSTQTSSVDHAFANPEMLVSRNGKLHIDLVAAPATYTIAGHRFQGMLYNGQYVPPLWRLHSGDAVTVTLHNQLSEATNLHFHGLGVSPLKNGDNVFVHISPGETFTYEIKIPERHVGLFWFHPHMHGDVDRQIIGGMSGGILIEGSERVYPFLKDLTERVLLIKHHPIGRADYQELVTVNGLVAPNIPIRPGEAQLWHIGNIGADIEVVR